MLSRRETLLLHVLVWVVVAAAAGIGFYLQLERRTEAGRKSAALREQLDKFAGRAADPQVLSRQKEQLARELEQERARHYGAQEMDPYRFGMIIRDQLRRDGLEISRYQTQEAMGENLLEFAVAGEALGLARFLQRVSESPKRWSVPFLSISAGPRGKVQAVFRIGYESAGEVAP
jgi:hypothetical protein